MRRGRAGSEKRGNQNDERAERGLHSTVALSRPRGSGRVRSRSRSASTKRLTPASIKSSKNIPNFASAIRPYAVPSNPSALPIHCNACTNAVHAIASTAFSPAGVKLADLRRCGRGQRSNRHKRWQ